MPAGGQLSINKVVLLHPMQVDNEVAAGTYMHTAGASMWQGKQGAALAELDQWLLTTAMEKSGFADSTPNAHFTATAQFKPASRLGAVISNAHDNLL